jgi:putative heme-binding domain-containing protein
VRLAEPLLADSAVLREKLYTLTSDDNLRVRYQLAFSLGYVAGPQRARALATLVKRDPGDNWMRLAIRSSLAEGSGELLADLVRDAAFRQTASGRDWLKLLGEQIGKQQRDDDVADLLATLAAVPTSEAATLQAILQGVAAKPDSKLATQIAAATGGRASELTTALVMAAAKTAIQADQTLAARLAAVQQLRLGKITELRETLAALLEPAQPAELQQAALAVLGTYRDLGVADLLLNRWPGFSPRLRGQAAEVLFSRPEWVSKLLDQAAAGTVATSDVDPSRWQLLTAHADESIRRRAVALVGKSQTSKRGEVVTAYRDSLTKAGDVARGKEHFKKVCAACHQLEGIGHPTGPNLAAMKNRGPEAILLNVLDPNREVNPQYLNYSVVTNDGRTLSGMIAAETATSVTLKRADNASDTVLRIDIEQLKSTGLSLMPEGMEKQIDSQAMADLLAYLKSVE